ncbi:MAG: hypothetical protein IJE24_01615, partial [Oscillospiraceae bacterium]|nr:hypothetical protein [Oscillospiraceae bacterium]
KPNKKSQGRKSLGFFDYIATVIANQPAGWCGNLLDGWKLLAIPAICLKNRGIPTPVFALARNGISVIQVL